MVYILKIEKNMNIYYNKCDNFSKGGCLGMNLKVLLVVEGDYYLKNYEEMYWYFDWVEVEKYFFWYEIGKLNVVYEVIDCYVELF